MKRMKAHVASVAAQTMACAMTGKMHHWYVAQSPFVVLIEGEGPFDVNFIHPEDDPRTKTSKKIESISTKGCSVQSHAAALGLATSAATGRPLTKRRSAREPLNYALVLAGRVAQCT
jgi:hypothetical protein